MDMFTYRKFKSEEGVENAKELPDAAKPYCIYSEQLIELQKDLCERLWTHKNPYTGLSYADDPVFVLAEIANECDLFHNNPKHHITVEPYKTDFLNKLDIWLKEKGIDKSASEFDVLDFEDETLIEFKIYLQEKYYSIMMEKMRECGVKIPITGNNWVNSGPGNLKTQLMTDYYDAHPYFYNWKWGEFEAYKDDRSISGRRQSYLALSAYATAVDKPTYLSEWDMPWPNVYRAESPVYTAAIGMFQGWSGFAIHTYSYSTKLENMNMLGKEFSCAKIGNIPYRQGIFSAWNDPAKFGLFYHAALITRRGDVSPSKEMQIFNHLSLSEKNPEPAIANLEKTAVIYDSSNFPKTTPPLVDESSTDVLSDTKELYRNWEKRYGYIDSPKTKCAYGMLGKNGNIELNGVKINCETDFATIALSSLDENDITASENILLTAVGRAENTGFKTSGDIVLDIGKPPVLIEVIEADIEIKTDICGLIVWAISAEGYYIGNVPTTYEDGKLKFKIGTESQSMYYMIVKE